MKKSKKKLQSDKLIYKTNIATDFVRTNLRLQDDIRKKNKLFLDKNENLDAKLNLKVKSILSNINPELICKYPDLSNLYKKLSKFHKIKFDNLYLAGGIDVIIRSFFELFISKNDTVVMTRPTFLMYEIYAKIFKANIEFIDYTPSLNGPVLDLRKFYSVIDLKKPRAVFLANPNSPTGTILSSNELLNLIKYCQKRRILFFLDEAYYLFYNKTYCKYVNQFNNLLVARTFSKAWGLAGLRAGYAIANKNIIDKFNAVAPMYPINSIAIFVIENLLDNYIEVQNSVKKLKESKNYFIKELKSLGFFAYKTYGNFCNVNFNGKEEIIYNKLKNKIAYKKSFAHKSLKNYSRFSLTTKNNYKKILDLISE